MANATLPRPLRIPVPVTQEGFETYMALERFCQCTRGGGGPTRVGEQPANPCCGYCNGSGLVLTEAGSAWLAFIDRHRGSMALPAGWPQ